jgi:hypothetical protein
VAGLCVIGAYAQSDQVPDGQCEGIGFGCTPSPRDGALIAFMFWGVPVLTISLLVCLAIVAIVGAARDRRRPDRTGPHK